MRRGGTGNRARKLKGCMLVFVFWYAPTIDCGQKITDQAYQGALHNVSFVRVPNVVKLKLQLLCSEGSTLRTLETRTQHPRVKISTVLSPFRARTPGGLSAP